MTGHEPGASAAREAIDVPESPDVAGIPHEERKRMAQPAHLSVPAHPAAPCGDVEAAVDALGSLVRVAIVAQLRRHGAATRGELAQALAMDPGTVQLQLGPLRRRGVVVGSAIRATRADRHRMLYAVDEARTRELLAALTAELLGE
jgi:DNA-binding transcriptional ArsR family regulator